MIKPTILGYPMLSTIFHEIVEASRDSPGHLNPETSKNST